MAPQPSVSFLNGATLDSFIGTQVTTTVRFDNTASGAQTGYAPFINLILPTNGADGAGAGNSPVNDGVTFVSAKYLGADLESTLLEFPASGVVNHPFAKLPSGAPMTVTGTPGTTLLVLKLPFGSFTTTQTPTDIELKLNISNLADLNAPLPVQATGGFAFGADEFDNTSADPVILGTAATQALNPTVAILDKIYLGPEQETATGPSYPRTWQVQGDFAPGQPFTNVTLTDRVPDGVVILGTPRLHDGAGNVLPGTVNVTGPYGSQVITAVFNGTIIGGAVKPTLEFDWYVTEFLSTGAPVLDPATGVFRPLLNDAKLDASWDPIDGRDPITITTIDPAGPEDIVTAKSIAVQKSVELVNGDADSNGVPDWQPGGTLEYTLDGQVSNYFEMKELKLYDTLGDGQTFKAGFTPTVVIREGGSVIYTGPVVYTLGAKNAAGETPITFDISQTMTDAGLDRVLDGNGGGLGAVPHATDYNQATVLVTFQSTLDMNWTGPVPGDNRVDQGDPVGNKVLYGGDVFLTDVNRLDDSAAGVTLPINDVDKSIYAINGDITQGTNSFATKPLIQAGDLVTYRLKLDIPLTSSHDVTLKDFLPLPVFLAADPDANGVANGFTYAGITNNPGVGQWSLMTSDQLQTNAPGVIPGVSVTQDAVGNSVLWNFGDIINNNYPRTQLDMLFTVRVNDRPFGDGLLLTNQVTSSETNSFNTVFEDNDIIQFVLGEPRLKITKGVVAENNTAGGFTVNATTNGSEVGPAGVTWNAPGSGTPFTGTITSAGLASRPVDANLFQADARDTVTFAVVLENIGSGPRGAFDTLIRDTIPTGFTLGAVPLNLKVVDGTGAAIAYTGSPADLFTTGIELVDPAARQGAVGAFSPTSGKNIVVITYDLRLDDNVQAMDRLVNTATTADYAAENGGINRTTTDNLPDSNTAFVEITPKIGKEVIATSNPDTGTSEGDGGRADLAIGETVTWRVTVTVPEGVSKNLTIRDVLPGGVGASTSGPFELVSVTTATVGSNIVGAGVLAGSTGVISNSNADAWMDTVVFSFGDVVNAPDNVENAADRISFDITARVLDTPGNVRGQTETNIATVSVTNPAGDVRNTSVTSSVELVEPVLSINKSVSPGTVDADDTFTYTVTLTNTNGGFRAPAYEVSIDDLLAQLPPNAVFLPGTVALSGAQPAGTAIITGNGGSDTTVKVTTPKLMEGQSVTFTFQAKATAGAISGQTIPNVATATGTSMPGSPPSDRTYNVQDDALVTIASPSITKSVSATSFADTGDARHTAGRPDVKVDEIVTYTMVVTVPEGQSINFRVVDTLADQLVSGSSGLLQYIPGSAKVISAGSNLSSTTGILTPTVSAIDTNANGTTDRVTYSFGNVTNTADNVSDAKDQITFEIQARAQNVSANQNADVLTNRVQAFTDFSQSNEATASVDFVQPELDVQKTTTFGTGDAADIATYTVVVRHTAASTANAYNIALGDILPPGVTLVPLSATTTAGTVTEVPGGIQLNMASYNLGSAPITITYQVRLADNVVDGQVIRNTVNLEYRTDPTPGRILTDSDDATINVDINDTIVKDIIATSNPYTPGSTLVPGEEVTFRLTVTLGEGAQRLTVQDSLPAGLEYVSSKVTSLGGITGSALAVNASGTHNPGTNVVNFNFGDVINPGNNVQNTADQVVIEVVAKVAAGVAAGTNLTNIGTVTPFVPSNPYGVTPGTPMPPSSDNEVVNVQGLAAVGDRAFIDLNADGQQQGSEPGLAGVQVQLFDADSGALIGTRTTDGSGLYLFTNLQPGKYYEVWNLPSGYVRTDADTGPDATDSDAAASGPNAGRTSDFTLTVNQTDLTRDAGYWAPVRLGDRVFEDQNGNGIQDGADTPMANVTVNLLNGAGTVIGTQQTDSNGNYLFTGLKPGQYSVEFIRPAGYAIIDRDVGSNDAIDSDANVTTGRTVTKTYISGDDDRTVDAGMYRPVTIGDTVFQDNNGNGIQDAGDTPLGGVTVNLRDGSNGLVGTLVTDSSGQYLFTGLKPGSYRVEVIKPTGYVFTAADAGANDATDSDTNVTTGLTPLKTYASGADDRTVDSGLFQPVKLGDYAWVDRNANGVQDSGEAPLAGVQVQLVNAVTGAVVANATTGADGKYEFTVPPGTYREIWTPPAGYVATQAGQGTAATDSDVNPATGQTATITLVSGQDDMTWDGGYYIPVRIGDRVFEDQNADGIQDAGDTNLANVRVDLLDGSGNVLATQFTDVNGNYLFTGLRPQDYAVKFTAPAGFNITDRDVGLNDTIDSDASPTTGNTVVKTYFSGDDDRSIDAGMWRPVTIGDRAWEDQNGNGIQDSADTPMAGVTVNLLNGSGVVVGTQTTDSAGNYLFTGLKPGTYSVEFVRPAGFVFTDRDTGLNDAIDSDASITTGRTGAKTYTSGNDDRTVDGGMYRPVTIGDTVFEDNNGNGIQDAGDTPLGGVTVRLLDGSNTVIGTLVTDSSGQYLFTGIKPGSYRVEVVNPTGYVFTTADVGTNDAIDSDTNPANGLTPLKTYASGADDRTVDSGLFRPVKLGDQAWIDRDGDGIQDPGEAPLAGVQVQLVNNATGAVIANATTGADGKYEFIVPPGTYREIWTPPAGYVPTITGQGTAATDSNVNPATGQTGPITLVSGRDDMTWDGGFYIPVRIGDRVFEDQNGNGIQDAEDTNLANVRVDLLDGSGNVVGTQFTDASGNYLFTGLRPQDYAVKFTAPAGFNITDRDVGSNDAIDSDASPVTGNTVTKTYFSGDVDLTIDAGMWRPVTIGDRTWVDINGDGLQQTLEPGLGGVAVRLIDIRTGAVVGTQTTDASGNYLFTGYKPSEYRVEFAPPAGWEETTPLVGGNRAIDSNPNAAGVAPPIRLLSGQEDRTIDAGYVDGGKVTGNVFLQLPPGICGYKLPDAVFAGIKVELITTSGFIARTTTTDAQGQYEFVNLVPGTYVTRFTAPDGTMFSLDKQAGTLDPRHSDVNPDGVTDAFTINLGQHVAQVNAGLAYKNVGLTGNPGQVLSTPGSYNFDHPGAYVIGLNGSYNMMGNGGAPYFIGGTGDNNLQAGGNQGSIMVGGHGSNIFEGSGGRDIIIGGCGVNNIQGLGNNGQGLGTASGCWNYDLLVGGPQADIITGNHGRSIMLGGRGNDAIDGFGQIVGGPNSGTISFSGGQFSNFAVGDHIKIGSGQTTVHYQVGDGVQWIENFNPGRGDTIEIWGYGAPTAVGTVNGMGVLYFGPNAALVFNSWQPQNGALTGINYHAGQAQMAGAFGRFDALPPVVLYNGMDSFYGTQGDDIAIGSNFPTTFRANGGDDLMIGGNGHNLFIGGTGNDQMIGGQGNDIFRIGQGSDVVVGCGGNNVVQLDYTAAQVTVVNKGNGNYVLMTPAGEQQLSGIQWVQFTDQNLRLTDVAAAPGAVLFGTNGHDGFQINSAADMIVERANGGNDAAWVSADGWIMSPEVEVARLIGNAANIKGNALDNIIVANAGRTSYIDAEGGNDEIWGSDNNGEILNGGAGDDIIRSGLGTTTMIGGEGNDQFVVNNIGDLVVERPGEGIDTAWVSADGWTVGDNIEIVRLFGNATSVNIGTSGAQVVANTSGSVITAQLGDNVFWGQGGNDTFVGGAGNDIFYAGGGATTMYGGGGNDHFVIKNLGDRAWEAHNEGYDTAWVAVNGWTVGDNIEVTYLSGSATSVTGNATGGHLVANSGAASTLTAGAGYTTFWGSNFDDVFKVGPEGGVMYGYGGADDFWFGRPSWGTVEVADFSRAEGDKIHFAGSGITHMGQLNIVAYADKTLVQHGADQIILYGVTAPLQASDFVF